MTPEERLAQHDWWIYGRIQHAAFARLMQDPGDFDYVLRFWPTDGRVH